MSHGPWEGHRDRDTRGRHGQGRSIGEQRGVHAGPTRSGAGAARQPQSSFVLMRVNTEDADKSKLSLDAAAARIRFRQALAGDKLGGSGPDAAAFVCSSIGAAACGGVQPCIRR